MDTSTILIQAFVYLSAALFMVPIARRFRLGSVLGYLLAGVLMGPFGLHLVGEERADVMHFAEFGVVMMLFLVGLELAPERLWKLRGPIFGLGGLQVTVTAVVLGIGAMWMGLLWQEGLALGLVLAMSSTAIALQSLAEKGRLGSDAGQKAFAVLLFQDIAVIPMLAIFPLLATREVIDDAAAGEHGTTLVEHLPAWGKAGAVLAAIVVVIALGRFAIRPFLRMVAQTQVRELFTAAALVIVIGVTIVMQSVGLSPALGTFLAGVVLANSEYRHELESDIEPFKGLLLGLFFLAIGASIDFHSVMQSPLLVFGLLFASMAIKGAVLFGLGRGFGSHAQSAAILGLSLAQIGEFAFVLLTFAERSGVLPEDLTRPLVAVTALSMAASPLFTALGEAWMARRWRASAGAPIQADTMDEHHPVILAGYGRFGQIAGRFLRAHGIAVTVLDVDPEQVETVRRFGHKVFFGDASRVDLLRSAGAAEASVLIVAVDQHAKALEIVEAARKHFPHLRIFARARGRGEAYEFIDLGIEEVHRETFESSLRLGVQALAALGFGRHRALRAAQTFRRYDEATLRELAAIRHDQPRLVASSRERQKILEEALLADRSATSEFVDPAWDSEPLRSAAK
jgi:monovalent cation:proton antiporter-2 (CPA2) family protein